MHAIYLLREPRADVMQEMRGKTIKHEGGKDKEGREESREDRPPILEVRTTPSGVTCLTLSVRLSE